MRRLLVLGVCLTGLAVSGVASAPAASEPTARPLTKCVEPRFRGVAYWRRDLRATWLRVGARIGTVEIYRNYTFECRKETRPVYQLRGIAPAVAISLGGSSRQLLVRLGVCEHLRDRNDASLVRCLRG